MATATEELVKAYANCPDGRCYGYQQQPVDGVKTTTTATYLDHGGDLPGIESSFEDVRFADASDVPCPEEDCGRDRMISTQERPEYPNTSGHDPMGIFDFRGKTEKELRNLRHQNELDAQAREFEMADMRRQMDEMRQLLLAQQGVQPVAEDEPVKRGPGRPRKEPQDG